MEIIPERATGSIPQPRSTDTPPTAPSGSLVAKIQALTVVVKREVCNKAAVSHWRRPSAISTTTQSAPCADAWALSRLYKATSSSIVQRYVEGNPPSMNSRATQAPASSILHLSDPVAVPVSLMAATRQPCCRRPMIRLINVWVLPASIEVPQTAMICGCAIPRVGIGARAKSRSFKGRPSASPRAPSRHNLVGSATLAGIAFELAGGIAVPENYGEQVMLVQGATAPVDKFQMRVFADLLQPYKHDIARLREI